MKYSKFYFSIFALFVLFNDELFYGFLTLANIPLESGLKSIEAVIIAGIAYLLLGWELFTSQLSRRNFHQLLALFGLLALYFLTGLLYPHTAIYDNYWAHFLVYGALCIPACYVGMKLARGNYSKQFLTLLPYFVIVVSSVVGYIVVFSSRQGVILGRDEDSVFNYQIASYYLSYCFSYCVFYVFLNKEKGKSIIHNWIIGSILLFLVFYCALGSIMGGGRGAFVYLFVITIFLMFQIFSRGKGGMRIFNLLLLVGAVVTMTLLANRLNVFNTVGAERVIDTLTTDEYRVKYWRDALNVFGESPLWGHGVGSIWWTVGFYSHNIVTDLLAETGIIGAGIVLFIIVSCFVSGIKRSRHYSLDLFMLIMFAGVMTEVSFSGYWISSPKIFLMFGYVFGMSKAERLGYC